AAEGFDAISEEHERNRRRHGEADPGRERAEIAGARQADRQSDLAARRPWQELAERNQIGIGLFIEPLPAHDELVVEVAEMRDRAAEAGEPEPQKDEQDFARGPWLDC